MLMTSSVGSPRIDKGGGVIDAKIDSYADDMDGQYQ